MTSEPEFQQAYDEIVSSVEDSKIFEKFPQYKKALPIVWVPERIIQFRVTWENDTGEQEVAQGYRVQFNSAKGPYKGGLRSTISESVYPENFWVSNSLKDNALTGLDIGGGKGGLCVDLKGKSDNEIRRIWCHVFMENCSRHIGKDTDAPAGDIGVGGREIGYLFGVLQIIQELLGRCVDW